MALTPETMRMIWLFLVVVLLIIELVTVGLTTIWFAAGSVSAFLLSLAGLGIGWQIGVFLVCFHRPVCVYQALGDEICQ